MNKRDAYGLGVALALMLPMVASADGFSPFRLTDEGEVCYSWNGGNFSAGSFSKCQPTVQIAVLQPVTPAPLAAAPTPAPVMQPMQSCPPLPVPHRKPIIKRRPKVQC